VHKNKTYGLDNFSDSLPSDKTPVFPSSVTTQEQTYEQYPVMGYPFLLAHSDIEIHSP
jgi:hypothetical protein